ncbi:uncharacterized protein L199_001111 [Kwoniella botswanensis]|uniref:uncharacterized protein n=1 Tax=Kwoniella botswanensis TaxID=1268659 RepID=UPI00315D5B96
MGIRFDANGNFLNVWDQGQPDKDRNLSGASGRARLSNFVEKTIDLGPGESFGGEDIYSTYWLGRGVCPTSSIVKVTARDQPHSEGIMEGTLSPSTCPSLTFGHYVFSVTSEKSTSTVDSEPPDEAAVRRELLTELNEATNGSTRA